MLRDTKQRLTPARVRRWALRCGAGLLLGAGICAAATGTAHADARQAPTGLKVPDLGSQARAAVVSLLPPSGASGTGASGAGTSGAGTSAQPVSKPAGRAPATRIVQVIPPTTHAGRHRTPVVPGVTRTAKRLLGDTRVGGTLREVDSVPGSVGDAVTPRMPTVAGLLTGVGGDLLPALDLPVLQLPVLHVPELAGLPVLPLPGTLLGHLPGPLPVVVPGASGPSGPLPGAASWIFISSMTSQGPAGTASQPLSRVALPDAPSAPAAPRGPRPTGPVPALPAGTGAGAALHLTTACAEPAISAGHTPSGLGTLLTGFAGPAPRDRAGMPSITPD